MAKKHKNIDSAQLDSELADVNEFEAAAGADDWSGGAPVRKAQHFWPSAKRLIIDKGYDEKYGARPLRRAVQDELEHAIADGILSGEYEKGTVLTASGRKGTIHLDVTTED